MGTKEWFRVYIGLKWSWQREMAKRVGASYLALMHLLSRYTAITLRGVTGKSKMVLPPVKKISKLQG